VGRLESLDSLGTRSTIQEWIASKPSLFRYPLGDQSAVPDGTAGLVASTFPGQAQAMTHSVFRFREERGKSKTKQDDPLEEEAVEEEAVPSDAEAGAVEAEDDAAVAAAASAEDEAVEGEDASAVAVATPGMVAGHPGMHGLVPGLGAPFYPGMVHPYLMHSGVAAFASGMMPGHAITRDPLTGEDFDATPISAERGARLSHWGPYGVYGPQSPVMLHGLHTSYMHPAYSTGFLHPASMFYHPAHWAGLAHPMAASFTPMGYGGWGPTAMAGPVGAMGPYPWFGPYGYSSVHSVGFPSAPFIPPHPIMAFKATETKAPEHDHKAVAASKPAPAAKTPRFRGTRSLAKQVPEQELPPASPPGALPPDTPLKNATPEAPPPSAEGASELPLVNPGPNTAADDGSAVAAQAADEASKQAAAQQSAAWGSTGLTIAPVAGHVMMPPAFPATGMLTHVPLGGGSPIGFPYDPGFHMNPLMYNHHPMMGYGYPMSMPMLPYMGYGPSMGMYGASMGMYDPSMMMMQHMMHRQMVSAMAAQHADMASSAAQGYAMRAHAHQQQGLAHLHAAAIEGAKAQMAASSAASAAHVAGPMMMGAATGMPLMMGPHEALHRQAAGAHMAAAMASAQYGAFIQKDAKSSTAATEQRVAEQRMAEQRGKSKEGKWAGAFPAQTMTDYGMFHPYLPYGYPAFGTYFAQPSLMGHMANPLNPLHYGNPMGMAMAGGYGVYGSPYGYGSNMMMHPSAGMMMPPFGGAMMHPGAGMMMPPFGGMMMHPGAGMMMPPFGGAMMHPYGAMPSAYAGIHPAMIFRQKGGKNAKSAGASPAKSAGASPAKSAGASPAKSAQAPTAGASTERFRETAEKTGSHSHHSHKQFLHPGLAAHYGYTSPMMMGGYGMMPMGGYGMMDPRMMMMNPMATGMTYTHPLYPTPYFGAAGLMPYAHLAPYAHVYSPWQAGQYHPYQHPMNPFGAGTYPGAHQSVLSSLVMGQVYAVCRQVNLPPAAPTPDFPFYNRHGSEAKYVHEQLLPGLPVGTYAVRMAESGDSVAVDVNVALDKSNPTNLGPTRVAHYKFRCAGNQLVDMTDPARSYYSLESLTDSIPILQTPLGDLIPETMQIASSGLPLTPAMLEHLRQSGIVNAQVKKANSGQIGSGIVV
jgi:hypothetical protein